MENSTLITVLYGLVGVTGALSAVLMIWGFVVYIMRLGTVRRETGIEMMGWGVRFIITAVVLIGVLHLTERWFL